MNLFFISSLIFLEIQLGLGLTNFADTKCGQRSVNIIPKVSRISRIAGGVEAVRGEFPWIISLQDSSGSHFCGGFLISNRYAITAAHCLQVSKEGIQVIIGEHVIGVEEVPLNAFGVGVESMIPHPEYNRKDKTRNDIGIIRLQDTIEWNAFVQPACLPNPGELVPIGEKASVAGWGSTDNQEMSNTLMTVDIPVVAITKCTDDYVWTPTDSQFCAGLANERRGACRGDSGAPLMFWENSNESLSVVGIHSAGAHECGAGMLSGIYTRMASYIHWIKYNMR